MVLVSMSFERRKVLAVGRAVGVGCHDQDKGLVSERLGRRAVIHSHAGPILGFCMYGVGVPRAAEDRS